MSVDTAERLYQLLPAVYRLRDSAQGEPLRALFGLIEKEYGAVELDILGLYENWFIETCQEWVVPYIGDLLGVRSLNAASPGTFSQRAYVAHTVDYRRRKGTVAILEEDHLLREMALLPFRRVVRKLLGEAGLRRFHRARVGGLTCLHLRLMHHLLGVSLRYRRLRGVDGRLRAGEGGGLVRDSP